PIAFGKVQLQADEEGIVRTLLTMDNTGTEGQLAADPAHGNRLIGGPQRFGHTPEPVPASRRAGVTFVRIKITEFAAKMPAKPNARCASYLIKLLLINGL